jgi:hypothetical protein
MHRPCHLPNNIVAKHNPAATTLVLLAALLWHNLTPEGKLEPRSLHAGCPVVSGVK